MKEFVLKRIADLEKTAALMDEQRELLNEASAKLFREQMKVRGAHEHMRVLLAEIEADEAPKASDGEAEPS